MIFAQNLDQLVENTAKQTVGYTLATLSSHTNFSYDKLQSYSANDGVNPPLSITR